MIFTYTTTRDTKRNVVKERESKGTNLKRAEIENNARGCKQKKKKKGMSVVMLLYTHTYIYIYICIYMQVLTITRKTSFYGNELKKKQSQQHY